MEILNGKLDSQEFQKSFRKLLDAQLPIKKMIELRKSSKELNSHLENVNETRKTIIKGVCKCDDKGEPIVDEKGGVSFEKLEHKISAQEKLNELMDEKWDFPSSVQVDDLLKHELTTGDLMVLDEIIVE